jgi:hypothetical protein
MDIGQRLRGVWSSFRRFGASKTQPVEAAAIQTTPDAPTAKPTSKHSGRVLTAAAVLALVPLYYGVGALLTHRINDDLQFVAPAAPPNGSKTVALMAALISREVDQTAWSPNTPAFAPAALLRFGGNMVNFQSGLIKALSTFSLELEGRLGRQRGTGGADNDLGTAREGLSRQPDTWILSPLPTSSADGEYRRAAKALLAYNQRLSSGQATFDVRSDNLLGVLDRIALDLGDASNQIDQQIEIGRTLLIDRRADKLFYFVKGKTYSYAMILRALKADFAGVLAERRVSAIYDSMLNDLDKAAALSPLIVQNGSPEALSGPNHLTTQGFYLLRARSKLREITDVLAK